MNQEKIKETLKLWWVQLLLILGVILIIPFSSSVVIPFFKWIIGSLPEIKINYMSVLPGAISGFLFLKILYIFEEKKEEDPSINQSLRFLLLVFPFTITKVLEKAYESMFDQELFLWNTILGILISFVIMEILKSKKIT